MKDAGIIIAAALLILLGVLFVSGYPGLLFAILAANGYLLVSTGGRIGRDTALFFLAAVFGYAGEAFCVNWAGLWIYHMPSIWGLPIWIPLVWGNLFCLFVRIAESGAARAAAERLEILRFPLLFAALLYLAFVFRLVAPPLVFFCALGAAAMIIHWHDREDILILAVAAFLGTIGEAVAINRGLWHYTSPVIRGGFLSERLGIDGIPLSLPIAWGISAVFIRRLASCLVPGEGGAAGGTEPVTGGTGGAARRTPDR